jgi:hypothetical protein
MLGQCYLDISVTRSQTRSTAQHFVTGETAKSRRGVVQSILLRERPAQFEDRVRKAVNSLAGFPEGAVTDPIDGDAPSLFQNLMNCRERGQGGQWVMCLKFGRIDSSGSPAGVPYFENGKTRLF